MKWIRKLLLKILIDEYRSFETRVYKDKEPHTAAAYYELSLPEFIDYLKKS